MRSLARRERRGPTLAGEAARTEYLAFSLGGDIYAVRISMVAEILRPPPITEVPRAGRSVVGVVSVRGRLVTVIDARRKLNLPDVPIDVRTRILLVDPGGDELIGLLVDEVLQVHRLGESEIEPASVLGGDQAPHILGIGRPDIGRGSSSSRGASSLRGGAETSASIVVLVDVMALIQTER